MTVNLGLITGEQFFYGNPVPNAGQDIIIKLKSRYSNKYLMFDAAGNTDYLRCTFGTKSSRWFSLLWTDSDEVVQDLDIAGYYDLEIYNVVPNTGRETFIRSCLAKVNNDLVITQVDFTSTDNEDGEQVIYYRQ